MVDDKKLTNQLLEQAATEQSFRKQILSVLAALLKKKETQISLKILIVLGLLNLVSISFVFAIFLIHGAVVIVFITASQRSISFNPFSYVIAISVNIVILMVISIPLIIKAGSQEAALRLEDSLNRTYNARLTH